MDAHETLREERDEDKKLIRDMNVFEHREEISAASNRRAVGLCKRVAKAWGYYQRAVRLCKRVAKALSYYQRAIQINGQSDFTLGKLSPALDGLTLLVQQHKADSILCISFKRTSFPTLTIHKKNFSRTKNTFLFMKFFEVT